MQTQTQVITKSTILSQFLNKPKELISELLYRCDLQTIKNLRHVSKAFLEASTHASHNCTPLSLRAITTCHLPYYLQEDENMTFKLAFSKTYFINISIIISYKYLTNNQFRPLFESIIAQLSQKKTILTINTQDELNSLEQFVISNPNLSLFNHIEELVIKCDIGNNTTLTILQNPNFSNLTSLTFKGTISDCSFTLSSTCTNLKTLIINKINSATFTIPASCINLETLIINDVCNYSAFIAESPLSKLKNLTLNCDYYSSITLPQSLPNLTNLVIHELSSTQGFPLPPSCSLPLLQTFNINKIIDTTYTIPNSCINTETLIINEICFADFTIPNSCINLKTLTANKINAAILTIPTSCINIETLIINNIYNYGNFMAECPLSNLRDLTVNCHNDSTITLPQSLPTLTNLVIHEISPTRDFPLLETSSFPVLETITIKTLGNRGSNVHIDLSHLFSTLKKLSIEHSYDSTITFPSSWKETNPTDSSYTFYNPLKYQPHLIQSLA